MLITNNVLLCTEHREKTVTTGCSYEPECNYAKASFMIFLFHPCIYYYFCFCLENKLNYMFGILHTDVRIDIFSVCSIHNININLYIYVFTVYFVYLSKFCMTHNTSSLSCLTRLTICTHIFEQLFTQCTNHVYVLMYCNVFNIFRF